MSNSFYYEGEVTLHHSDDWGDDTIWLDDLPALDSLQSRLLKFEIPLKKDEQTYMQTKLGKLRIIVERA